MPSHSNLNSQTAFPASTLWSASVSGCLGPHPMHLSCQTTPAAQAPDWQPPLSPLGSSSSGSEGMPYYFSPQWQHSCCHCTSWCRHSVLSNLRATAPHQHVGHESSHSTSIGECSLHSCMYDFGWEDINHFVTLGSSYSVESSTLVVTLSSSNVAVTHQTARR